MPRRFLVPAALLAAVLFPAIAHAHPADAAHVHGLAAGLTHPLTGLDHLLVMVAIGAWATRLGPRSLWLVPASFVAGMAAGILRGPVFMAGDAAEATIALSVIALGLLLAFAIRLPAWASAIIAGLAGLAHGAAHGAEGPQGGFLTFAIGALAATALLHAAGTLFGLAARRQASALLRGLGGAMLLFGLAMLQAA